MSYPNVHKVPHPLVPPDFSRLDMLWERYPRYHDMQTFSTLDELLEEHESYQEDFDEEIRSEYVTSGYDRFLVRLSWDDLPYRQATRRLIEAASKAQESDRSQTADREQASAIRQKADNFYVTRFMNQFRDWDTDHKAYFIFPESPISQFFVLMEVCKRAEEFHPISNLFPDEDRVHFLAVFDKQNMDDCMLMFHLVYGGASQEMPGGYSLYDYSLPWYLTHLWQDGVVLRSPYLPDRLAKYHGGLLFYHNPAKTVYVRRNIDHILEAGYFDSELEFFHYLNEVMMPVFQWWYLDLALYEEKDKLRTNWRLERTRIRTRMTAEGIIKPKWKHELSLFHTVRASYPDTLYQYRPDWLGHQSLDLYIPSLNIAIEYQGIQHYTPVDFFGGQEALEHRQELDLKKKELCLENRVRMIEWPYILEPTKENLRKVLADEKEVSS